MLVLDTISYNTCLFHQHAHATVAGFRFLMLLCRYCAGAQSCRRRRRARCGGSCWRRCCACWRTPAATARPPTATATAPRARTSAQPCPAAPGLGPLQSVALAWQLSCSASVVWQCSGVRARLSPLQLGSQHMSCYRQAESTCVCQVCGGNDVSTSLHQCAGFRGTRRHLHSCTTRRGRARTPRRMCTSRRSTWRASWRGLRRCGCFCEHALVSC